MKLTVLEHLMLLTLDGMFDEPIRKVEAQGKTDGVIVVPMTVQQAKTLQKLVANAANPARDDAPAGQPSPSEMVSLTEVQKAVKDAIGLVLVKRVEVPAPKGFIRWENVPDKQAGESFWEAVKARLEKPAGKAEGKVTTT